MSPLFASEYCAALAPGRIELTRRRGGLRRRTQAFHCANLETARDEGGSWSFALTALESLLKDDRPMRGRLRVVLSSHWVRYQLIPWNDALLTPDELAPTSHIWFSVARAAASRLQREMRAFGHPVGTSTAVAPASVNARNISGNRRS